MIDPQVFLTSYVIPAARALGICNVPHLQIGLGIPLQESGLRDIAQIGGGPALGPCQMERATHDSLQENFIRYKPTIKEAMASIVGDTEPTADLMMTNMIYACFMMFVKLLDCPGLIPTDIPGQAAYWKKWYNASGKGTVTEYVNNWKAHATDVDFSLD